MTTIKYRLANGKIVEIEVTEAQAEVLIELKRQDESHHRKFKRRTLKETSLDYLYDEFEWEAEDKSVDILRDYESTEAAARVRRAVDCLSKKQQLLVRLHFYEGKQFVEIAERLGVSKSAITQQFKTIYVKLKKYFENILNSYHVNVRNS